MNYAKDRTILQWTDDLSSAKPTPGGGGVGALLAALAASLSCMVSNLTISKKGYENFHDECEELLKNTDKLREELLHLIDEDAIAFDSLMAACKLGANDKDYAAATEPSVRMVFAINSIVDILEILNDKGNKNLISDVGVGASCAKAALETCNLNIRINLKYIKSDDDRVPYRSLIEEFIPEIFNKADNIYRSVVLKLQ